MFVGMTSAFLAERCQRLNDEEYLAEVIFDCLALFCMSLCTSVYAAMAASLAIFQPYTHGPYHLLEEGV
jgi:hypothetical protein